MYRPAPSPILAGRSHVYPGAVVASQPRSRVNTRRSLGSGFPASWEPAGPAPRSQQPGVRRAATAATYDRSSRPGRHTSLHGDRPVRCRRRRLSPRRTTVPSPPAARRLPRRPSTSAAPSPPKHSPFIAGTARAARGTASAHSLRDTEEHSPRRLLPPLLLLLLPPLGPRPSPPPPPPPAPPSAPAPAPPAILLLLPLPPPLLPSPLLSVAQAPGLLLVSLAAILTPRGSIGSARPYGACAALRSRPEPRPLPTYSVRDHVGARAGLSRSRDPEPPEPRRGCWTRRDFHDVLNPVWVYAEQSEPVQKRLDGRRCRAAVNAQQDFRKAVASLNE
ncbi:wiskott-Aldrich syndrome protein homolog 1-like [Rhinolophus ferrumequinum]|uniref:wiskott-Aldrich syndrome protein homolog 1-like n=1 Tax=Rhinolophus ferrumequinum TaxID=59479 RepID=UPI00140F4EF8|nr:wiskott-Aldrich syndrome protein homolog 1-like [Rhinolophus ferrumequinum]